MTTKRSRYARRRHQQKKRGLFALLGGLVLVCFISFLLVNSGIFGKMASPSTKTTSESSQVTESTTEASDETKSDDIVWEVQTEPVSIPILMYHAIHDMAPEEEANANLIVSPAVFESHLQALQEASYYTLTPEEAYKVLTENVLPQGKKVVWLTFDDSLWDFYSFAYPLLQRYHMHATNNVITGFTESGMEGHLTLDQLVEMQANGMSFQSHTVNHPDLEYSSIEEQNSELYDSKNYLDTQLSQDTIAVAYPAGRYSSDTLSIAEAAGYKLGLTTNEGLASSSDGLLSLNRVRILPTLTPELLLETIAY